MHQPPTARFAASILVVWVFLCVAKVAVENGRKQARGSVCKIDCVEGVEELCVLKVKDSFNFDHGNVREPLRSVRVLVVAWANVWEIIWKVSQFDINACFEDVFAHLHAVFVANCHEFPWFRSVRKFGWVNFDHFYGGLKFFRGKDVVGCFWTEKVMCQEGLDDSSTLIRGFAVEMCVVQVLAMGVFNVLDNRDEWKGAYGFRESNAFELGCKFLDSRVLDMHGEGCKICFKNY